MATVLGWRWTFKLDGVSVMRIPSLINTNLLTETIVPFNKRRLQFILIFTALPYSLYAFIYIVVKIWCRMLKRNTGFCSICIKTLLLFNSTFVLQLR